MGYDHRQALASRFAKDLESGRLPWASAGSVGLPINPVTGKTYRGGNALALLARGHSDPRWCTFEQAKENGWNVRRGEASTVVEFWKYAQVEERRNADGSTENIRIPLAEPVVKFANVFNASQFAVVPELVKVHQDKAIAKAEALISAAGISVFHQAGRPPIYDGSKDALYLPPLSSYADDSGYYAEVLRLVVVAADHPSRLPLQPVGGEAARSLTHEIAGAFLSGRLGIRAGLDHAAAGKPLDAWAGLLRADPNALYRCAREAERLVEFVVAREKTHSLTARNRGRGQDSARVFPTSEKEGGVSATKGSYRLPLYVPFQEIDQAKKAGARWDKERETWYAPPGVDAKLVAKWIERPKELSEREIVDQFADACREAGLMLDGPPIMDGKWHRTGVDTAKNAKAKQGVYIGHLDGDRPNGYIENKLTGFATPWSVQGVVLSAEQRERYDRLARESSERRAQEMRAAQDRAAEVSRKTWDRLQPAASHAYLTRKQVLPFDVRLDRDALVIPMRDVDGKIWSLQRIFADSSRGKMYVENGRKTGCFHVIGDLTASRTVLFAEGYATGASLHMATSLPVVLVFDSGNIANVVEALKPTLADRQAIICGDDDVLTPARVLSRLNGMLSAEKTFAKLQLRQIDQDELLFDGSARPAKHNPLCAVSLREEAGPEGVPRIVGQITNTETKQVLRVMMNNVGREKALAAAAMHPNGKAIFPTFASMEGAQPTDYNDLHVREGIEAVKAQLGREVELNASQSVEQPTPGAVQPYKVFTARADGRYIGKLVAMTEDHITQEIGRGIAVTHLRATVAGVAPIGVAVEVAYAQGRGELKPREFTRRLEMEVQR